jgi:hypothetical protein
MTSCLFRDYACDRAEQILPRYQSFRMRLINRCSSASGRANVVPLVIPFLRQ